MAGRPEDGPPWWWWREKPPSHPLPIAQPPRLLCVNETVPKAVEQMVDRDIWLILRSDAGAAIGAIHKGYSRKMSYLRRTQRVSIGFLHDFVGDEHTALEKVHTDSNDADVLTKSLEKEAHWRHSFAMGMRPVEEE